MNNTDTVVKFVFFYPELEINYHILKVFFKLKVYFYI